MKDKDYYTTGELVRSKWFPRTSTTSIQDLCRRGLLKFKNLSNTDKFRPGIDKQSAWEFAKREDEKKEKRPQRPR